jgi:hypothetical protein
VLLYAAWLIACCLWLSSAQVHTRERQHAYVALHGWHTAWLTDQYACAPAQGTIHHQEAQQRNLRRTAPNTQAAPQIKDATDQPDQPLASPVLPEQQYQVPFSNPGTQHPHLHHHGSAAQASPADAAGDMPAAGDPAGLLAGKGIFRDELFAGSGSGGTGTQRELPTSSAALSDTAAGQAAHGSTSPQQDQSRSQQAGSKGADEAEELLLQEPNPFSGDPTPGPFSHRPTPLTPSSSEALTRQAHAAQQLGPREQVGNPKPFIQGNEGPDIGLHQANRKGIIARAQPSGQDPGMGSGDARPAPGGGRSGTGPAAAGAGSQASGTAAQQAAQQASRGFGIPKAKRAQAVKKKKGRKGRLAGDVVPGGWARLAA